MMGGKAAAESLLAMRRTGDFSKASTKQYEAKWKKLYGHDFWMSKAFAEVVYRCPILLDAVASEMQRKVGAWCCRTATNMVRICREHHLGSAWRVGSGVMRGLCLLPGVSYPLLGVQLSAPAGIFVVMHRQPSG